MSDMEIKTKGMHGLIKELGEADAIRFLSQIRYEKRDYLVFQEKLFKGMSVDEIFEKAKAYENSQKIFHAAK